MNSRWNENLIIFTMKLVLTHSYGQIKIRIYGAHQESTPGQIWLKLLKISEELGFDIKRWKMLFCGDFGLVWHLVNPRLIRGILVEKDTLSAPVFERVVPHYYICSCDSMERKWYFWVFPGPAHKSRVDKIRYQHSWQQYVVSKGRMSFWCWLGFTFS